MGVCEEVAWVVSCGMSSHCFASVARASGFGRCVCSDCEKIVRWFGFKNKSFHFYFVALLLFCRIVLTKYIGCLNAELIMHFFNHS